MFEVKFCKSRLPKKGYTTIPIPDDVSLSIEPQRKQSIDFIISEINSKINNQNMFEVNEGHIIFPLNPIAVIIDSLEALFYTLIPAKQAQCQQIELFIKNPSAEILYTAQQFGIKQYVNLNRKMALRTVLSKNAPNFKKIFCDFYVQDSEFLNVCNVMKEDKILILTDSDMPCHIIASDILALISTDELCNITIASLEHSHCKEISIALKNLRSFSDDTSIEIKVKERVKCVVFETKEDIARLISNYKADIVLCYSTLMEDLVYSQNIDSCVYFAHKSNVFLSKERPSRVSEDDFKVKLIVNKHSSDSFEKYYKNIKSLLKDEEKIALDFRFMTTCDK